MPALQPPPIDRLHDSNTRRNVILWLAPAATVVIAMLILPFASPGWALSPVAVPLSALAAVISASILGRNYSKRSNQNHKRPRLAILSTLLFLLMICSMQFLICIVMSYVMFLILGAKFLPIA